MMAHCVHRLPRRRSRHAGGPCRRIARSRGSAICRYRRARWRIRKTYVRGFANVDQKAAKRPRRGSGRVTRVPTKPPAPPAGPGFFISFEGIDGSGKSTQARLLKETLSTAGHNVILTREPGGSPGAEEIRALVLQGDPDRWSAETELLLFNAARRDHVERTILPAITAGKIVICDRFADSSRMYQGIRAGLRDKVDLLHAQMIGLEPDMTLLIDMDPQSGLARAKARAGIEERFEDFGLALQQDMRDGFLGLAQEFRDRIQVIDGNRSIDAVQADILALVTSALAEKA